MPSLKREVLLLRNKSLLKQSQSEISERDNFYVERVVNESMNVRGVASLFTVDDPEDKEFDKFEQKLVELTLRETSRLLGDLKPKTTGSIFEQINQHEQTTQQQLDQYLMLANLAATGKARTEDPEKIAGRRQANLEVANALKDLSEAKSPLDKMFKVANLFKATKKAEKLD